MAYDNLKSFISKGALVTAYDNWGLLPGMQQCSFLITWNAVLNHYFVLGSCGGGVLGASDVQIRVFKSKKQTTLDQGLLACQFNHATNRHGNLQEEANVASKSNNGTLSYVFMYLFYGILFFLVSGAQESLLVAVLTVTQIYSPSFLCHPKVSNRIKIT